MDARGGSCREQGLWLFLTPLYPILLLVSKLLILYISYCFLNIDVLNLSEKDHLLRAEQSQATRPAGIAQNRGCARRFLLCGIKEAIRCLGIWVRHQVFFLVYDSVVLEMTNSAR